MTVDRERLARVQKLAVGMITVGLTDGRSDLYEEALSEMVIGLMRRPEAKSWAIWVRVTKAVTDHFRARIVAGSPPPQPEARTA